MSQRIRHTDSSSSELLGWVWHSYLKHHTVKFGAAALFMMVQGGMLGLISYLIEPVFDDVFEKKQAGKLFWLGLAVMGVFVVRGLSGFLQRMLMTSVGQQITYDVQRAMFRHVMTLDSKFFKDNSPGDLMTRVLGNTGAIQGVWGGVFAPGVRDLISIISLLVVALSVDWRWTLIAIAGIPLLALPILVLQGVARKYSKRANEAGATMLVRLDETLHNMLEIKLYLLEQAQIRRFLDSALAMRRASIRGAAAVASVPALVDVVAGVGFLGFLMFAGRDVIAGTHTVGQFMSFFTAAVLMFDPAKRLGNLALAWQNMKVVLERVRAVLDVQPTIAGPKGATLSRADVAGSAIEFRDVHLDYEGHAAVDGLSFRAEDGKVTALVGHSGAGKTSVFNLVTRIIDPAKGTITVGGQDIRQLALDDLRSRFAVVSQDSGIFDESIRTNIMYGKLDAGEKEFDRAVDVAHIADFAEKMAGGYDTEVGPRGSKISGGQRQRIAIARAIMRDADILLLDEPTSALDSESEAIVQKAIMSIFRERTMLVIAHRLSTVRNADKILVLKQGRLVEEGTHGELIAREGEYANLCKTQLAREAA